MKPYPAKILLVLAVLSFLVEVRAQEIVVFAKGDSCVLGSPSMTLPKDPARAAFLAATERDVAQAAPYDVTFPLVNPPSWGRTVSSDTRGALRIRRSFAHGFRFHLDMEHLLPGHNYVLCINGRPEHAGNELLPQSVSGHAAEKFYDFFTAVTDDAGSYHAGFALFLRPGAYNVHFYVKDPADFKIVLYGVDYFDFTAN